jgi:hypothetical protein
MARPCSIRGRAVARRANVVRANRCSFEMFLCVYQSHEGRRIEQPKLERHAQRNRPESAGECRTLFPKVVGYMLACRASVSLRHTNCNCVCSSLLSVPIRQPGCRSLRHGRAAPTQACGTLCAPVCVRSRSGASIPHAGGGVKCFGP